MAGRVRLSDWSIERSIERISMSFFVNVMSSFVLLLEERSSSSCAEELIMVGRVEAIAAAAASRSGVEEGGLPFPP